MYISQSCVCVHIHVRFCMCVPVSKYTNSVHSSFIHDTDHIRFWWIAQTQYQKLSSIRTTRVIGLANWFVNGAEGRFGDLYQRTVSEFHAQYRRVLWRPAGQPRHSSQRYSQLWLLPSELICSVIYRDRKGAGEEGRKSFTLNWLLVTSSLGLISFGGEECEERGQVGHGRKEDEMLWLVGDKLGMDWLMRRSPEVSQCVFITIKAVWTIKPPIMLFYSIRRFFGRLMWHDKKIPDMFWHVTLASYQAHVCPWGSTQGQMCQRYTVYLGT